VRAFVFPKGATQGQAEKADRRRSLMSDADEPKPAQSSGVLATEVL
jgi:hypothetical protein